MKKYPEAKPVFKKLESAVAHEWDLLSHRRSNDIQSGRDLSYIHVIAPLILELLGLDLPHNSNILDVGCGTGDLTAIVSKVAGRIVGIDSSEESVRIAKNLYSGIQNCTWEAQSIQEYSKAGDNQRKFDVVIANMFFMDTLDLDQSLKAITSLGRSGTLLVWTITHPTFWPFYWGYNNAPWFDYSSEIQIESEFRSSAGFTGLPTTHVHRPLSFYLNLFADNGFLLEKIVEPMPDKSKVPSYYFDTWKFPRFLGGLSKLA